MFALTSNWINILQLFGLEYLVLGHLILLESCLRRKSMSNGCEMKVSISFTVLGEIRILYEPKIWVFQQGI